jgi:hypothetical protein
MINWIARLGLAGSLMLCGVAALPARAQDDVAKQIVNVPSPGAFTVYGLADKPKLRKDAGVQGGQALRIVIPAKGATPYAIGLQVPVAKPVKKGDRLVLAFWARFDQAEGSSVEIANAAVQLAAAPYSAFMGKPVTIGPAWKLYSVEGTADRDYAAGEIGIAMQLATGKQVIDIGPVFLLDLSLKG